MKPAFVTIAYRRDFPYTVDQAYAWLTDYQDDDPARTSAVVKRRPVLKREPGKVTMEGELEMLGVRGTGIVEVSLHPPDRWVAEIVKGGGRGSIYEYQLTPTARGCRLDVNYRVRVRRWSSRLRILIAKPLLRRELDTMWDGFAASMAKDMGSGALASAPRSP